MSNQEEGQSDLVAPAIVRDRDREVRRASPSNVPARRPHVHGKFIFVGDEKFYIRGVTYGPFRPDKRGCEYGTPAMVERDFTQMSSAGINAVRTYTVPPKWLLDIALRYGLHVMVGVSWEQHVTFIDDRAMARSIESKVRDGIRACAGHPAVLCYVVGNEIPAPIARWYGRQRMERFIRRLYTIAKEEDPDGLVTYVNYPTTEYLQLPFLDFICFNVYLESSELLENYLARLQNIAGDLPLVMAEVGLDSRRNGERVQAQTLDWSVRTVFEAGCAGLFIFSWTDEWHRGGYDIEDWDFGITDRERRPKLALTSVRRVFAQAPFSPNENWPRISVIVCAYNAASTIRECLEGLKRLVYPDYEVIVVDDGSADGTVSIALASGFRVIRTENRGLSSARNTGMEAATGDIVAYIDADAYPDEHWLSYLASAYMSTSHAGIGGPNLPPPGDGYLADCVACAPGGPIHVLISDWEAEHIPGCNISFRKKFLQDIGGFDPRYREAGDDVDVCWRLQHEGRTLGFSPGAVVWHHRRNTLRGYWKQQIGYGKAEALLERKWPEKYNAFGHLTWKGRMYGRGHARSLMPARPRVYHGVWGTGLFQSMYAPAPYMLGSLPLMPEWHLVNLALAGLSVLGSLWKPLLVVLPLLIAALLAPVVQAVLGAVHARFPRAPRSLLMTIRMRALTTVLHLLQPLARLIGRLQHGLAPLRRHGKLGYALPGAYTLKSWSEQWESLEDRLLRLELHLRMKNAVVQRGGDFDRWDLQVRNGTLGAVRIHLVIEEHGGGRQLPKCRIWPKVSANQVLILLFFAGFAAGAGFDHAWSVAAIVGLFTVGNCFLMVRDCATATATTLRTFRELGYTKT